MNDLQTDGHGDQNDNNPFEHFHAPIRGLVRNLFVNACKSLKLADDAGVPFLEVKSLRYQPIQPSQLLVAQQFQRVVNALEKDGAVHLKRRHASQIGAVGSQDSAQIPGALGKRLVGLIQRTVHFLVQIAHFEQFDIGELELRSYVIARAIPRLKPRPNS